MKSKRVNHQRKTQVIFRRGTQFFRGTHHTRFVDVSAVNGNASKAAWKSKSASLRTLHISRPSWDFGREYSNNLGMRPIEWIDLDFFYSSSSHATSWEGEQIIRQQIDRQKK